MSLFCYLHRRGYWDAYRRTSRGTQNDACRTRRSHPSVWCTMRSKSWHGPSLSRRCILTRGSSPQMSVDHFSPSEPKRAQRRMLSSSEHSFFRHTVCLERVRSASIESLERKSVSRVFWAPTTCRQCGEECAISTAVLSSLPPSFSMVPIQSKDACV